MWWSFVCRVSLGLGGLVLVLPSWGCDLTGRDRLNQITTKLEAQGASVAVVAAESKVGSPWLINWAGDRYFVPASLVKLFTTAAALTRLQPDFRIPTRLWGKGSKYGLLDDLILEGNGDPSFNSMQLQRLVRQLAQTGIKRINRIQFRDRLAADLPSGWEWQDLIEEYGAPPHGLIINFNALAWRLEPGKKLGDQAIFRWQTPELAQDWQVENRAVTSHHSSEWQIQRQLNQPKLTITGRLALGAQPEQGATVVLDPPINFQRHLELELKNQGILVQNQPPSPKPQPEQLLAIVYSPSLKALISTTNKDSENLYAENLRVIAGKQLEELWSRWAIDPQDLILVDGSGLARRNRLKPRAVVQLLQAMANNAAFRNSLAIAGIDGTLKLRLTSSQIIGKTGTLEGIAALAGYILGEPELAFVLVINHGDPQAKINRQALDAIALELKQLQLCKLN